VLRERLIVHPFFASESPGLPQQSRILQIPSGKINDCSGPYWCTIHWLMKDSTSNGWRAELLFSWDLE